MTDQPTIYELAGGDAPFRELVERFYARIERDPLLRPLFPEDLEPGKQGQFLFITQYFGGPPRYNQLRGHPRLRMRHAPFPIDREARDRWMELMGHALDEAQLPPDITEFLREFFGAVATMMMNRA